jgi:hypothetical protein
MNYVKDSVLRYVL